MSRTLEHPRLYQWLLAAAAVVAGSLTLLLAARAAQWETRFIEVVRPMCNHAGLTNEEMHRLVRNENRSGISKQEAIFAVMSACQTNR